ncbi:hypothetical protein [uncultured Nocardioides sp.]|uniref:hypothetical protein n=1 Tax=uncultured Nocardioides sp. TaxID=198441 RepID=UPI0025EA030C|nr:hypothetical protein [uncultured Nocardioides sp.]
MSLSAFTLVAAAAEHGEPALSPYAVGGVTLAILLALLLALLAFGGGREHS